MAIAEAEEKLTQDNIMHETAKYKIENNLLRTSKLDMQILKAQVKDKDDEESRPVLDLRTRLENCSDMNLEVSRLKAFLVDYAKNTETETSVRQKS